MEKIECYLTPAGFFLSGMGTSIIITSLRDYEDDAWKMVTLNNILTLRVSLVAEGIGL